MSFLPPSTTPLNQHSLKALESWLMELGAEKSQTDPCLWNWVMPAWSAQIKIDIEQLRITWKKGDRNYQCSFPYGLSRKDVQIALFEGP